MPLPRHRDRPVSRPRPGQPRLTERETALLTYMSQGMTYEQAAVRLDTTMRAAWELGHRINGKLGSASITQAVHIAGMLGLIGWGPDCGSRNEYLKHLRRGEPADRACLAANADHRRRNAAAARARRTAADSTAHAAIRGTGNQ